MAWVAFRRLKRGIVYRDTADRRAHTGTFTIGPLHYESSIDSGTFDAEINCTPVRVDIAAFDGWRVTANGWHYALGKDLANHGDVDGWVGFGGRQGAHWVKHRLLRVGYLHWPTRTWEDIGGAPAYDRIALSRTTKSKTVGPNDEIFNVESIATWENVWNTPGDGKLDISWRVDGDRLKEEITLNQAGREWIAANRPPATPLGETWFGFVFDMDWLDIPRIYRQTVLQDMDGDWSDDGEQIELCDALDRLLAFMPISDVTAGTKFHAGGGMDRAQLRKRLWRDGDNWYLLVGVRCDVLNGMRAGPLVFDPTFDIADTDYDAHSWGETAQYEDIYEALQPSQTVYGAMYFGHDTSGGRSACNAALEGGFQFTPNIPQGSTILTASLTVQDNGDRSGTVTGDWYGFDEDNVALFTYLSNNGDCISNHATRTSASVADDWSASGEHTTPSLVSIIQEIVNRAGWSSGNRMGLTWRSDLGADAYWSWVDYTDSSADSADLTVTWLTDARRIFITHC